MPVRRGRGYHFGSFRQPIRPPSPTGIRVTAPLLLVIGASARAFSASAHRAGWRVRAADLFADRDLGRCAEAVAVPADGYPAALEAEADRCPPGPFAYVGALENHPALVDAIAARRPLAGCPGSVLRRVRDPRVLAAALAGEGIAFPATRLRPDGLPLDGSWLVKPRRGAGGRGIAPWDAITAAARRGPPPGGLVWQRRVGGTAVSASFVVDADGAVLLGASRQLLGEPRWHAPPFAWCGAVDVPPESMGDRALRHWERVGAVLRREFGVSGAVGVDAVERADGTLVVVEVNPRPTASMELVERRSGASIAALHLAAHGLPAPAAPPAVATARIWAKAVLRTPAALPVDARLCDSLDALDEGYRRDDGAAGLADLPRAGTTLPAGSPALTVFASAPEAAGALAALARRAGAVQRLLGPPPA